MCSVSDPGPSVCPAADTCRRDITSELWWGERGRDLGGWSGKRPWRGRLGWDLARGPQGDIRSCGPARLEGVRETGRLRPRLPRSQSHGPKTTPVTAEASGEGRREARRPSELSHTKGDGDPTREVTPGAERADQAQACARSWEWAGEGAPSGSGHRGALARTSVSRAGRILLTAILLNARTERRALQVSLT